MTGPDPLEADPLEAALDRYARAFPKSGLPFLRGAAAGPEARRVALELLDHAVATFSVVCPGRPPRGRGCAVAGARRHAASILAAASEHSAARARLNRKGRRKPAS